MTTQPIVRLSALSAAAFLTVAMLVGVNALATSKPDAQQIARIVPATKAPV